MDLYIFHDDGRLEKAPPSPFAHEKELQRLIEANSNVLFDVEFIKSEMTVGGRRIDTLCFDQKTKSFVIVEYKISKQSSMYDQGHVYLSLINDRRADCLVAYQDKKDEILKRDDVNWNESRVIFVSPGFTSNQKDVAKREDQFDLWEVRRYSGDGDILVLRNVGSNRRESPGNNVSAPGLRKVKSFEEEHHKKPNLQPGVWDVYERLRDRVLAWEGVEMNPKKLCITFRRNRLQAPAGSGSRAFLSLGMQNSAVWGTIGKKRHGLDDPRGIAKDVSGIGHHGSGDYRFKIGPGDDLDYVEGLVRQSYHRC